MKANTKSSFIRDQVATVIANAQPNTTYATRCTLKIQNGKLVRRWSIFTAGITRSRKAKKS